jgi:hypothetical protein
MPKAAAVGVALMLLVAAPGAFGQRATEVYIPIGQSPGVSGRTSVAGTIATIDRWQRTLVIADGATRHTAVVTADTRIWMDRSGLALPNLQGTFGDLQEGLRAEMKYAADAAREGGVAEWIKVGVSDE